MRACDSDVGMPKIQVTTPQTTIATIAAHKATSDICPSPPKLTMPEIVSATAVDMSDMSSRPRKLQTAAMAMADGPS